MTKSISLSGPDITDVEINCVLDVLRSPTLSIGPQLDEFERLAAAAAGRRYGVAVNSGTSALHLIVRALGLGEGDEVITTPFSFVASSNVLLMERVKPVFVDIDPMTLNIDASQIESAITSRTKALLVVDVFGQAVDMEAIASVAARHDLQVIEDSCEAIGGGFNGIPCGKLGVAGAFAFYPNKQITTGEGGCLVTDDEDLYRLARSMRNQGRGDGGGWLEHERLGYNYRMSELQAALGVAQLGRLSEIVAMRTVVAHEYTKRLRELADVTVPYVDPRVQISWFVYVIRVSASIDRDLLLKFLREHGVGCRNYFAPIHLQPFYREQFGYQLGDFPVTEAVAAQTIALPFYNRLSEEDIDYVCATLEQGMRECRK